MQKLPTRKELNALFKYDGDSGNLIYKKSRGRVKKGSIAGYMNDEGYRKVGINKKYYSAHRIIFFMHYGYWPQEVDHIDHDISNNKIENLRSCTRSENRMNSYSNKNATSRYKGVFPSGTQRNPWKAKIKINGRTISLGNYKSEVQAAKAYNLAAIEYFGDYALLNNV